MKRSIQAKTLTLVVAVIASLAITNSTTANADASALGAGDVRDRVFYANFEFAIDLLFPGLEAEEIGIIGGRRIAVADFNGDGRQDFVVDGGSPGLQIYLTRAAGNFERVASFDLAVGAINIGDFNEDGRPDIAAAARGTSSNSPTELRIVENLGNEQFFLRPGIPSQAITSLNTRIFLSDFNDDEKMDILMTNNTSVDIEIFFGAADGTFPDAERIIFQDNYTYHRLQDFNRDGRADLLANEFTQSNSTIFPAVIFADSDGGFSPDATIEQFSFSVDSFQILGGVFDMIRLPDIETDVKRVAVSSSENIFFFTYTADDGFSFQNNVGIEGGKFRKVDLNSDGSPELFFGSSGGSAAVFDLSAMNSEFAFTRYSLDPFLSMDESFALADISWDDNLDVIGTDQTDGIGLVSGSDGRGFRAPRHVFDEVQCGGRLVKPVLKAVVDINGDGMNDLFAQAQTGSLDRCLVAAIAQSEPFDYALTVTDVTESDACDVQTMADLNLNGRLDAVGNIGSGEICIHMNAGAGTFDPALRFSTDGFASRPVEAVVDVDGDGYKDVVTPSEVLLNNGSGLFGERLFFPETDPAFGIRAVGDIDQDGFPDIVFLNRASSSVRFLKNDNGTAFLPPATISSETLDLRSVRGAAILDINEDGLADLVFGGQRPQPSSDWLVAVFLQDEEGEFSMSDVFEEDFVALYPPGGVSEPKFARDFNQDGFVDVALLGSSFYTFRLGGADGVLSAGFPLYAGGNQFIFADMNSDGKPDLVNQWGAIVLNEL